MATASRGSFLPRCFWPNRVNVCLALVLGTVLGTAGIFVRLWSECWSGTQDCAAYSPVSLAIADLVSWPAFATQRIAYGASGFVSNYDPILSQHWWIIYPMLWIYYYLVIGTVRAVIKLIAG